MTSKLANFMAASAKVIADAIDDEGLVRDDEKCSCGICDGSWTRGEKERHYAECSILLLRGLLADGEPHETIDLGALAEAEAHAISDECSKEIDEIMADARRRIDAVIRKHYKATHD